MSYRRRTAWVDVDGVPPRRGSVLMHGLETPGTLEPRASTTGLTFSHRASEGGKETEPRGVIPGSVNSINLNCGTAALGCGF